jgi:hypothetical protein
MKQLFIIMAMATLFLTSCSTDDYDYATTPQPFHPTETTNEKNQEIPQSAEKEARQQLTPQ